MIHRAIKDLSEVVKGRYVEIKVGQIDLSLAGAIARNQQTLRAINNAAVVHRLRVLYAGNRSCV